MPREPAHEHDELADPFQGHARYIRQVQFAPIGASGQERLMRSRVLICGCGALGSVLADILARAGIGTLRLVDRDFLEVNNLQRQTLYDEQDILDGFPKAVAAARRLQRINRGIHLEPIVADVTHENIESLLRDMDLVADGTDNFETRYLINDAAVKWNRPWVYGGCLGGEGQTLTVLPGKTPCFRCLVPDPPPPGTMPTCDTAGIVGPVVHVVGALQAMEVIKILSGHPESVNRSWTILDLWAGTWRQVKLHRLSQAHDCPTCVRRQFEWLTGDRTSHAVVLCGRNSVQISPPHSGRVDLTRLAEQWSSAGTVRVNPYLAQLEFNRYRLTVFTDGRAIVSGTTDPVEARAILSRYLGQ